MPTKHYALEFFVQFKHLYPPSSENKNATTPISPSPHNWHEMQVKTIKIWVFSPLLSTFVVIWKKFSDIHRIYRMLFIRTDNALTCVRSLLCAFFPFWLLQLVCCWSCFVFVYSKNTKIENKNDWLNNHYISTCANKQTPEWE